MTSRRAPRLPPLSAPDHDVLLDERRDVLGHVLAALSRESTLERLYAHSMDAVAVALGVDRASLLIFDQHDVCRFVAWRGVSDAYRAAVDGHSPWTPRDLDALPLPVADVMVEPALVPYQHVLAAEAIRSALFLPLVGRTRVWGKFMLYSTELRCFTPDEIEVAQLIVREIASALDWRERDRELSEERQLFAAGPTVVFKWRHADTWPVQYVSANLESVFGYAPDELLRGTVAYASIVSAADLARVNAEVEAHVRQGVEWFEQEYQIERKDGQLRTVSDFKKIVRNDGGVATHFLGYLVDVTERRAQEAIHARMTAQVQHAQKLESLGVLAGGIAHDFNNLLVGVLGNVSLALEELPVGSAAHPLLEDVQIAAHRAGELTRQLLAYSGRGTFVIEEVDLSTVVREMGRLLGTAVSKKARVIMELRDDLPRVRADATQVRQVVMNLMTNASDALGDAAGSITVRAKCMHATRAWLAEAQVGADIPEGVYVVLEVVDSGEGIPRDVMSQLFDPFFSTKGAGRGLGLAAVLGIVRSHRGAVRVVSGMLGTSIAVLFPVNHGDPTSTSGETAVNRSQRTVLVVDDDDAALRVAVRVLQRDGYQVLTASHGRAALELYADRGASIDVILLDLTMPELSGWETLRELRAHNPEVQVLLMSGYAQAPDAAVEGAAGFLVKPYTASDLRAAIGAIVSRDEAT